MQEQQGGWAGAGAGAWRGLRRGRRCVGKNHTSVALSVLVALVPRTGTTMDGPWKCAGRARGAQCPGGSDTESGLRIRAAWTGGAAVGREEMEH